MAYIERIRKRWRVVWDVGSPTDRHRRMQPFDTWEEANNFKKKIEYESSLGVSYDPSKMTVGQYFDHWLELHADNLAPKTLASYRIEIRNHIKPALGKIKLVKLSPIHLQNYYDSLKKEGKTLILERDIQKLQAAYDEAVKLKSDSKQIKANLDRAQKRLEKVILEESGGLSSTTIKYHHRIIHKALKQALKWQMVGRNVADAIDVPKQVKKKIEYLKKDQVHGFIACIREVKEYPIILTAIFTGMRQGEILGLRWQDIDLETGIIHVRQQLQYIPERGYYFKEPKKESMRNIPMPLPLNAVLRKLKKEQEKIKELYENLEDGSQKSENIEAGEQIDASDQIEAEAKEANQYKDYDLVFCNTDGSPMDGTGVTKRFQRLLVQNGLPKIRFHALRHTFATMCRAAGMDVADVQDLLGHADISTTKKMYTHIELEPLRRAMDKFTEYMEIES